MEYKVKGHKVNSNNLYVLQNVAVVIPNSLSCMQATCGAAKVLLKVPNATSFEILITASFGLADDNRCRKQTRGFQCSFRKPNGTNLLISVDRMSP